MMLVYTILQYNKYLIKTYKSIKSLEIFYKTKFIRRVFDVVFLKTEELIFSS